MGHVYDYPALTAALEDEIRVAYYRVQDARVSTLIEREPILKRLFEQWAREEKFRLMALLSVRREGLRRA